jgi:hypothetical protein
MATFRNESFGRMVERTLKKVASTLRDHDVPFCLIGSLSAWARGGPESSHDLDFGIREQDIMKAAEALESIGMTMEIPPEDWLVKAWDGEPHAEGSVLVDLIYAPAAVDITDEVLARCDYMDVLAHSMPVLNASDLMIMKLLSLREQHLNYTSTIATARAIREQVDWQRVRDVTACSPYAQGFFTMAVLLGICPPVDDTEAGPAVDVVATMQRSFRGQPGKYDERRRLRQHLSLRRSSPVQPIS